jgi:hypothetical protein
MVHAYTGMILSESLLEGPVSHMEAIGKDSQNRRIFLLASLTRPFEKTVSVFTFPTEASIDVHAPVYLWSADRASGASPFMGNWIFPPEVWRQGSFCKSYITGGFQHVDVHLQALLLVT